MFDNPAAADQVEEGQPSPAQLAIRETAGVQWSATLMLVPLSTPRYLLVTDFLQNELRAIDLLQPDGVGVSVLHGLWYCTAAISSDGSSVCLGCLGDGGVWVYDTAALLAAAAALRQGDKAADDEQVAERAYAPPIPQNVPAGAAFSQDANRLFLLWRSGYGITVHDPRQPELPVLRKLPFSGQNYHTSNYMLACNGGLLAAAAGGGDSSTMPTSAEEARLRRQVRLWRVDAKGETELQTVENADLADSVAIRSDGSLIAVGLRNGVVRLLPPPTNGDVGVEHNSCVEIAPEGGERSPMAHTLCFSPDGSRLVAGRVESEDFTIYDVASAAVVDRFVHPGSDAFAAAFFPAGDVLVTGTHSPRAQCMFHRLLPPTPRFEFTMSTSANIASADIAFDDEHGAVVAMTAGSLLEVYAESGKVLLRQDLGEEIFSSQSKFRNAVRMHPSGKFVACIVAKKVVVVFSVVNGSESLRTPVSSCCGFWWSPDGALLALATGVGCRIFCAESGFEEVQGLLKKEVIFCCIFDSKAVQLAVSTMSGLLTIFEVDTWTPTRTVEWGTTIISVCFSQNGQQLVWHDQSDQLVLLPLGPDIDSEPQLLVTEVNAAAELMFSPDDNFLLCCPSVGAAGRDEHRMRVLNLATSTDAEWGELLRTMALPVAGGVLCGRTLGWAQLSPAHSLAADTTGDALQWVLYGAVGNRFAAVDIQAALCAIHDNAWTVDQLTFCVTHQQQHVGSVVESAPHCSNVRDMETGETVLHCLARKHNTSLMGKWLEKCTHVTPVADAQGQTAVELAMRLYQVDMAQAMLQKLTPSLTSVTASLVMQELMVLSNTHPHQVWPFLQIVEPKVVRTLATFRTELTRAAEVCGLATATLADDTSRDGETTAETENVIPSIWADKCPTNSPKTLVASNVVVLPGVLGDADSSPFHAIVMNCDAFVFQSKLLQMIVQYKWEENVQSQRLRSLVLYGFAFVLGALAMVSSVTSVISVSSSIADVLQALVLVIEMAQLGVEAFELTREGCATYFTGPWNVLDVLSSSLLLGASVCHFVGAVVGVRTAGALGVALKCFGMVDYLRAWHSTGSLVRMISVIMSDMLPFMMILSFAMLGCMLFFTINLSSSPDFDSDSSLGLFRTLVTVYHMTLGIGAGIDISTASVTTVVVVTLFMSFVVVVLLNLLIAIMGDSYEKVKGSELVEAIQERARIIVEQEKRFPKSHRYHRFMHFVEPVDSLGKSDMIVWEGVTKRVSQMMRLEIDRLEQSQQKLGDKLVQMNSQMDDKFELLQRNLEIILDKLE